MSVYGEFRNQVLYLEINNKEGANSFGLQEAKDLRVIIKTIPSEARAVVLLSEGARWFCSGGNLSHYAKQRTRTEGLKDNHYIERTVRDLRSLKLPVIALVRGDCLGGGMELLAACDVRWSTPDACFGFWQRRVGLTFGWGGYALWRESVGERVLRKECLEARTISAYEAMDLGLIDRIIPRDFFDLEFERWLSFFTRLPTSPVPQIKRMNNGNSTQIFKRLWWGPDHRRALQRFTGVKG